MEMVASDSLDEKVYEWLVKTDLDTPEIFEKVMVGDDGAVNESHDNEALERYKLDTVFCGRRSPSRSRNAHPRKKKRKELRSMTADGAAASHGRRHVNLHQSDTASSSAIFTPPEEPRETFERRKRHRTREDKYVLKQGKSKRVKEAEPRSGRGKHGKHQHEGKPGLTLLHQYRAINIAPDRLALNPKTVGLFTRGRASSPQGRRGLPDLSFSEIKFLNHEQDKFFIPSPEQHRAKHLKKKRAVERDEEQSRFFSAPHDVLQERSADIRHHHKHEERGSYKRRHRSPVELGTSRSNRPREISPEREETSHLQRASPTPTSYTSCSPSPNVGRREGSYDGIGANSPVNSVELLDDLETGLEEPTVRITPELDNIQRREMTEESFYNTPPQLPPADVLQETCPGERARFLTHADLLNLGDNRTGETLHDAESSKSYNHPRYVHDDYIPSPRLLLRPKTGGEHRQSMDDAGCQQCNTELVYTLDQNREGGYQPVRDKPNERSTTAAVQQSSYEPEETTAPRPRQPSSHPFAPVEHNSEAVPPKQLERLHTQHSQCHQPARPQAAQAPIRSHRRSTLPDKAAFLNDIRDKEVKIDAQYARGLGFAPTLSRHDAASSHLPTDTNHRSFLRRSLMVPDGEANLP